MSKDSKKEILTIGGLPGSGKSTVTKLLVQKLAYKFFSTGNFARELAIKMGLTLEQFNGLVASDKSIDEHIDKEQIRIGQEENHYVIDSILGFHFIPQSFNILLTVPLEVAAERIWQDKQTSLRLATGDTATTYREVLDKTQKRILNHEARYFEHYSVQVYAQGNYDLVIDTLDKDPEAVSIIIMSAYKNWLSSWWMLF